MLTPLKAWTVEYFRSFPPWPRDVEVALTGSVSGTGLGGVSGEAKGELAAAAAILSDKERIDLLAAELRKLRDEVRDEFPKIRQEIRNQIDSLRNEAAQEVTKVRQFVKEVTTGGLAVQAMGLVWLLIGSIYSSLADEIARVVQRWGFA